MTDRNRAALRKEDMRLLGVNWAQKFLARHPEIKIVYIPPLDKEHAIAQDPEVHSLLCLGPDIFAPKPPATTQKQNIKSRKIMILDIRATDDKL